MLTSSNPMSAWFRSYNVEGEVGLRLFCFPYAGGSAVVYRDWAICMRGNYQVIPVELPGRGGRLSEPLLKSMPALIDTLADAIEPLLDKPYAFFGHSMGALIAFELARHLQNRHGGGPRILFASGRRAPQIPNNEPPRYSLPHDELIGELRRMDGCPEEVLTNADLMELMMPIIRADFQLHETYNYLPGPPLRCPITVFGGLEDSDENRERLLPWREQTGSTFSLHMLAGGHFFLRSSQADLIALVTRELQNIVVRSPAGKGGIDSGERILI